MYEGLSTQTRNLDNQASEEYIFTGPNLESRGPALVYGGGDQLTKSFRTKNGVALTDVTATDSDYTSGSGSQIDFARMLRADARLNPGPKWVGHGNNLATLDTGHEFYTVKREIEWNLQSHTINFFSERFQRYVEYIGYALPLLPVSGVSFPSLNEPSEQQKNIDGARLWGRAVPTKPEASAIQFFAEMREKMPAITGLELVHAGITRKAIAGEFLNIEFGIKPFINDLQKLALSVKHMHKIVQQYRRDSGKQVRRRRGTQEVVTFEENAAEGATGAPRVGFFEGDIVGREMFEGNDVNYPLQTTVTDISRSNVWFSGAFMYFLQESQHFIAKMDEYEAQANHLLGLELTPALLWELTPWSWLMDWNSDVGVFLNNAEQLASNNLCMTYGYVMHEIRATRTYQMTGLRPRYIAGRTPGNVPGSLRIDATISSKSRVKATPYGFGLDLQSYSAEQWAILAALGITHGGGGSAG